MTEAYRAVRAACTAVDRSDVGRIQVLGADRHSWLQGLLTNDIEALGTGSGCYAALLTPQGRMVSDLRLLEVGDALLVDVPARIAARLLERLEPLIIAEDVRLVDVRMEIERRAVHGPTAAHVLARALDADHADRLEAGLSGLAWHANRRLAAFGGEVVVAGTLELGVAGYDCYGTTGSMAALDARLAACSVPVMDDETWRVLRIEAGTPEFGSDMDETTIPLEAGLEARAISFSKGCYVGQEVIVRVLHRGGGRVARRLVGLRCDTTERAGQPGPQLAAGDQLRHGGVSVGRVTSAAYSPRCAATIALGYVSRDLAEPGTRLEAAHGDATLPALVSALPFVP